MRLDVVEGAKDWLCVPAISIAMETPASRGGQQRGWLAARHRSGGAFAGLELDEDVDEVDGGGGDAGDAEGLAEGAGADVGEFLAHFAREAADGGVVEPVRDVLALGGFEAVDGALLLGEVAAIFGFGFDGAPLVAEGGGEKSFRRVPELRFRF